MRRFCLFVCLFLLIGFIVVAQSTVSLDEAINTAGQDIFKKFNAGTRVAIININCESTDMSTYIIDKLTEKLVNETSLVIAERSSAAMDAVNQELNLQYSGDVSDETAVGMGKRWGAQAIINGSFKRIGKTYQLTIKSVDVETSTIKVQKSLLVSDSEIIAALMHTTYVPTINNTINEKPITSETNKTDTLETTVVSSKKVLLPFQFEIGIRGGVFGGMFKQGSDLSKVESHLKESGYTTTTESGVSSDFGAFIRYVSPIRIGVQTEFAYWAGSYSIKGESTLKVKVFSEYTVFDVPIMVVYSIPIGVVKLNLLAGLNISFPQQCTWTITGTGVNSKEENTGVSNETTILGFVGGIDLSIPLPIVKHFGINIGAKYLQDFEPYIIKYDGSTTDELFTRYGVILDLGIQYKY